MHRIAATVVVLALAGAGATAGIAAKPPKGGTLTLAAAPNPITFGKTTTLSGTLSSQAAGVTVRAQAEPYPFTGPFKDVGTATTGTGGTYTLAVRPDQLTRYRVTAATSPKATSPTVDVAVRRHVTLAVSTRTPKRGARVHFGGIVTPLDTGAAALVQRRGSAGWRTVRQVPLHPNATATASTYSVRLRVKSTARYRVRVGADAAYLAGTSRTLRLRVH
jgi:hypothetical protein